MPTVDTSSVLQEIDTIVAPEVTGTVQKNDPNTAVNESFVSSVELSLDNLLQDLINPEEARESIVFLDLPDEPKLEEHPVDAEEKAAYEVDLDALLADLANELGVANEHVQWYIVNTII